MIKKIITWPNKLLSSPSPEVPQGLIKSAELQRILMDMRDTLDQEGGVGLSAVQIGEPHKLFILSRSSLAMVNEELPEWFDKDTMVFINPQILKISEETKDSWEGCLSFPDIFLKFDRPKLISLTFQDETGKHFEVEAKDFLARAIMHEKDHLDGTVFLKYVGRLKREMVEKKLKKRRIRG